MKDMKSPVRDIEQNTSVCDVTVSHISFFSLEGILEITNTLEVTAMKKLLPAALAVLLLFALSACRSAEIPSDTGQPTPAITDEEPPVGGDLKTAAVIFDKANGSAEENIQQETVYSYEDITLEEIVDAMSTWSGLNFDVTISSVDGGVNVDWAADSSLLAGLDGDGQKEGYRFYDIDTMRWFMMDSMLRTLNENYYPVVYYTMDGGKELIFNELYPVNVFPSDIPYMGSPFYFTHADNRGDETIPLDDYVFYIEEAPLESDPGDNITALDGAQIAYDALYEDLHTARNGDGRYESGASTEQQNIYIVFTGLDSVGGASYNYKIGIGVDYGVGDYFTLYEGVAVTYDRAVYILLPDKNEWLAYLGNDTSVPDNAFDSILAEYAGSEYTNCEYVLFDTDDDGAAELLVRFSDDGREDYTRVYADVGGTVHLAGEFWSRNRLVLDGTATICTIGSNGADSQILTFLRFSEDGTLLEPDETWEQNGSEYTRITADGERIAVTENEYSDAADQIYSVEWFIDSLGWTPITSE